MIEKQPRVSVLICTYNRPTLLHNALASVLDQSTLLPDELIVVNGGDRRTDQVVARFQQRYPQVVRLVHTVNRNLAASRNVGLAHCTGSIVAMTDDDAEVFPDWLRCMVQTHAQQPQAGAVGGSVIGSNTDSLVGRLADAVTFPTWPTARSVRTLPGVNVSYKRIVLDQIGLQDEALFRGEDVDFNWRVQQLGYAVYYDPSIRVYHHHRPTARGFLNQHYMYGRAYFLVRRKWQAMYSVFPHRWNRPKSALKLLNLCLLPFYQPLMTARSLPSRRDRIIGLPLLFLRQCAWQLGVLRQALT